MSALSVRCGDRKLSAWRRNICEKRDLWRLENPLAANVNRPKKVRFRCIYKDKIGWNQLRWPHFKLFRQISLSMKPLRERWNFAQRLFWCLYFQTLNVVNCLGRAAPSSNHCRELLWFLLCWEVAASVGKQHVLHQPGKKQGANIPGDSKAAQVFPVLCCGLFYHLVWIFPCCSCV